MLERLLCCGACGAFDVGPLALVLRRWCALGAMVDDCAPYPRESTSGWCCGAVGWSCSAAGRRCASGFALPAPEAVALGVGLWGVDSVSGVAPIYPLIYRNIHLGNIHLNRPCLLGFWVDIRCGVAPFSGGRYPLKPLVRGWIFIFAGPEPPAPCIHPVSTPNRPCLLAFWVVLPNCGWIFQVLGIPVWLWAAVGRFWGRFAWSEA